MLSTLDSRQATRGSATFAKVALSTSTKTVAATELAYRFVETPIGAIAIVMSERGLRRVCWSESQAAVKKDLARECPAAKEDATLAPTLVDELRRYLAGEAVKFSVRLDPDSGSDLQRDIWQACRQVGYGKTASYGDLAERVGRPGAARAVGTAMARNPFPLIVPCHRIVRSDGGLGGYSGPSGVARKKRLLEMEAAGSR
ncbi:MAG: methylated-DNA--[protein]-cysteine S-methyltransferase [Phycisphaerales bacterium]|nr:methylated-DNA--[protein]-cysteine S-methyltransferase [Phycisphaerales bacterium]